MVNVFLDLGTHYGQGLESFVNDHGIDDTWIVHTFEANPKTYKRYIDEHHIKYAYVIPHNAAVYDHDGYITINLETPPGFDDTGQGSSVISLNEWNPWNDLPGLNFFSSKQVPCIDLAKFITDNFNVDDRIIIKMDVEGSEFAILRKLIDTGAINYINDLYVEWHDHYFTNKEEMTREKEKLIEDISRYNVTLKDWH